MVDHLGRQAIETLVLEQVRALAGEDAPAVARGYGVGGTGVTVDLAIAADEFIGVLLRGPGDSLRGLSGELAVCRRYFERVLAVVHERDVVAAEACDRHGAALWTVTADGSLAECSAGASNTISLGALFDQMTPDVRAKLIRPLIPTGTVYDRDTAPSTCSLIRNAFFDHFARNVAALQIVLRDQRNVTAT